MTGKDPVDMSDSEIEKFLHVLPAYDSCFPDEVAQHHLERGGFTTEDAALIRLAAFAMEKFVRDITRSSFAHTRTRIESPSSDMVVLSVGDVENAMNDHDMDVKKLKYVADNAAVGNPVPLKLRGRLKKYRRNN